MKIDSLLDWLFDHLGYICIIVVCGILTVLAAVVIVGIRFDVLKMRVERQCLEAGYTDYRVSWKRESYCVQRSAGAPDKLIPVETPK